MVDSYQITRRHFPKYRTVYLQITFGTLGQAIPNFCLNIDVSVSTVLSWPKRPSHLCGSPRHPVNNYSKDPITGVNVTEPEADYSLPATVKFKNECSCNCTPLPNIVITCRGRGKSKSKGKVKVKVKIKFTL
jgi:hypothetical protein